MSGRSWGGVSRTITGGSGDHHRAQIYGARTRRRDGRRRYRRDARRPRSNEHAGEEAFRSLNQDTDRARALDDEDVTRAEGPSRSTVNHTYSRDLSERGVAVVDLILLGCVGLSGPAPRAETGWGIGGHGGAGAARRAVAGRLLQRQRDGARRVGHPLRRAS